MQWPVRTDNVDDRQLVRRMLRGEEIAFEEFFNGYFARVYRFALARAGSDDAAEEITQETFVKAMRHLASFRGDSALITWLCAICRREIGAWCLRTGRRVTVALEEDEPAVRARLEALAAAAEGPHDALQREELARLVRVALDLLPSRYGDILEWKYLHDVPVNVIAERLQTSPKAAESLLTRARAAFRDGFTALTSSRLAPAPPGDRE